MSRLRSAFEGVRRSYAAKLAVALIAVVALTVAFGAVVHFRTADQLREDVRSDMTTIAESRPTPS